MYMIDILFLHDVNFILILKEYIITARDCKNTLSYIILIRVYELYRAKYYND
jgi:hypothetical protein